MIRLHEIRHTYGKDRFASLALRGISLEVRQGAFVALAGPSGSGKTSLLNIIGGLEMPSSGTVCIEGRDLTTLNAAEISDLRARLLGFVFQDFNLVPVLSAMENVEFPLLFRQEITKVERRRRAATMLERVGLASKANRRPNQLSGGERQRVALARALAGEPAIVLADEPTANLDRDTGSAIIELMRSLNQQQGTTFLYATHDPHLIARADSIFMLRDGQLEPRLAE